jgi:hypothetical protein
MSTVCGEINWTVRLETNISIVLCFINPKTEKSDSINIVSFQIKKISVLPLVVHEQHGPSQVHPQLAPYPNVSSRERKVSSLRPNDVPDNIRCEFTTKNSTTSTLFNFIGSNGKQMLPHLFLVSTKRSLRNTSTS